MGAAGERRHELRNRHFDELIGTPGLMWMGQNTNHLPAHPAVVAAMQECIAREEFHLYAPPLGLESLRRLILADLDLEGASVLVSDGAVAGLSHVCRTLLGPGDQLLTTDPTWAWPMTFARAVGAEVVQVPIYGAEHGYRLAPDRLAAAVTPRTRVIYLVDPNNPLGTCASPAEIAAIAAIARRCGAWLIHDCTYRHFARRHTLAFPLYPERTVTTYSFSKWLGLAGLRIGAILAAPDVVERLAAAQPNMLGSSLLAQRAAIAGLEVRAEWLPALRAANAESQALIQAAVAAIPGLAMPVYPSDGNFVIVECTAGLRPEALCAVLRRHGILVRQGSYHTAAFGDRFVKISTSVPRDWVEALCRVLPEVVRDAAGINTPVELF